MTEIDTKRGEIGLAELIKTLHQLPVNTPDQTEAIFHALGFSWKNTKPATIKKQQKKEIFDRYRYRSKPLQKKVTGDSSTFGSLPTPELPIELPKNISSSTLKVLKDETIESKPNRPAWLDKEGYQLLNENAPTPPPARENLFPTLTHRGILSAALTVKKTGSDINITALIKQVTQGRIPKTLTKNNTSTLQAGCQLLLDYNDSMVPFWQDLTALVEQIENLIGHQQVKVYEFDQDPIHAQHWTLPDQANDWQAEPGRPILIATNLNITGQRWQPPINAYWHRFIKQCELLHIPLLLLIPWQAKYWPTNLGNHPILMHWNPATTAAMVFNRVGKGHKVNQ